MIGKKLYMRVHARELISLMIVIAAVFIGLCLYSYNPYDASWFYYASGESVVSNWCGSFGAQLAGIAFYLFGGSSLLFVPLLLFVSFLVFRERPFKYEWERIVAFGSFIVVVAALAHLYQTDVLMSLFPGGHFGYGLCSFLYTLFDYVGTSLFLYTALSISFVLMTRLSFIAVAQVTVRAGQQVYVFLRDYQVPQRAYRYSIVALYYMSRPFVLGTKQLRRLLDGSALEATGLMAPEDDLQLEEQEVLFLQDAEYQGDEMVSDEPGELSVYNNDAVHPASQTNMQTPRMRPIAAAPKPIRKPMQVADYRLPRTSIFVGVKEEQDDETIRDALQERARILEEKLERFGVSGQVVSIKRGPVVTLFEYAPAIDTKISKILSLEDDLALALQALSIRILAPIPGRSVVGLEVANKQRRDVQLAKVVQSEKYRNFLGALPLVLGQDTIGNEVIVNLVRMPHLLIAGSTGSGKSVALNTMLMSLLCKRTPDELKLILIDPKRLEFASYADIAHLLFPIVTDPKKAAPVLRTQRQSPMVPSSSLVPCSSAALPNWQTISWFLSRY